MKLGALAAFLIVSPMAVACASTEDVRALANVTAGLAETYQASAKEFADLQNDLATDDARRIVGLKSASQQAEADTQTLLQGWTLANSAAGKSNLASYRLMTAKGTDELIAAMAPAPLAQTAPIAGPKLAEQVKSLREIGVAPDFFEQAQFVAAFGQSVSKRVKETLEEASEKTSASSQQADIDTVGVAADADRVAAEVAKKTPAKN